MLVVLACMSSLAMAQDLYVEKDQTSLETILKDEASTLQLMQNLQSANPEINFSEEDYELVHEYYNGKCPNKIAASVLGILLGDFGVQHFYVGQTVRGILDIVFCWTGIPAIIGLVEGIIWLCEDDATFESKFCN